MFVVRRTTGCIRYAILTGLEPVISTLTEWRGLLAPPQDHVRGSRRTVARSEHRWGTLTLVLNCWAGTTSAIVSLSESPIERSPRAGQPEPPVGLVVGAGHPVAYTTSNAVSRSPPTCYLPP